MSFMSYTCCVLAALVSLSWAIGSASADTGPSVFSLLDETAEHRGFRMVNFGGDTERASVTPIAATIDGSELDSAFRLTSKRRTLFWHAAFSTSQTIEPIRAGDILLLRFWARTIDSEQEDGNGILTAFYQRNDRPFLPALMETVTFGGQWTLIELPFRSDYNYPSDNDQLTLGVGAAVQTIEIAGVELLRYPEGTRLRDLPAYRITYAGRELDAPWRAAAERRIQELRTASMTVEVVDADGKPVEGATVRFEMRRHDFQFGAMVRADVVTHPEHGPAFKKHFEKHFNLAAIGNGLKWGRWENPDYRAKTLATMEWIESVGVPLHGHVLVWPSWGKSRVDLSQERLAAEAGDTGPLRQRIAQHIRDILKATEGRVAEWDVVNETWNNHDFMGLMGKEVMLEWFSLARQHAPGSRLFINDFGILTKPRSDEDDHRDYYFDEVRWLLEHGAELDAIGMQGHFGSGGLTPPGELVAVLDRFAELGLPITVTEYDLMTQDELLQADYTRDFLTVMFSHAAVDSVTLWGFWDGAHWRGNTAMYRRDWTLKPSGQAWVDLVQKAWWTDETVTSDAQGKAEVRGFKGVYALHIEARDGRSLIQMVDFDQAHNGVTVRLK